MQTAVERLVQSFTPRQPIANGVSDAAQDDATQFAAQLLQNYRVQLEQRGRPEGQREV